MDALDGRAYWSCAVEPAVRVAGWDYVIYSMKRHISKYLEL